MMGATEGMIKSVKCTAAVAEFTLAKPGADDDTFSTTTAVADFIVGVFQHTTTVAGEFVQVMLSGISRVKIGGTITRGDAVTTDGTGKGVAAAPGAGTNNRIIGYALASGVNGDIIPVQVVPQRIQG